MAAARCGVSCAELERAVVVKSSGVATKA